MLPTQALGLMRGSREYIARVWLPTLELCEGVANVCAEMFLPAQLERHARLHTKSPPGSSGDPASRGPRMTRVRTPAETGKMLDNLARRFVDSALGFVYCKAVKAGFEPRGMEELGVIVLMPFWTLFTNFVFIIPLFPLFSYYHSKRVSC